MFALILTFFAVGQPLVGVEGQTDALTKIPIGTSLHADSQDGPTSWVSSSGRFAFGFYPEEQGFAIGINMYVDHEKSLVIWKAVEEKGGIRTFSEKAVLTLSQEGFLLMPNKIDLIKFNNTGSPSAAMLDSGNFIVFDANHNNSDLANCSTVFSLVGSDVNGNSCVTWQSFDYPTDTMMSGQVLNCGKDLISRKSSIDNSFYQLSMQCDANLVLYAVTMNVSLNGSTTPESNPIWASQTEGKIYRKLILGQGGRLYLSSPAGVYQYNLSQYNSNSDETNIVYHATLAPNKYFRMFELNLITNKTILVFEIPTLNDDCLFQHRCGLNSYCVVINNRAECRCLPGFNFTDFNAQTKGCQRSIAQPECSDTGVFSMESVENLVWLDEPYSIVPAESKVDCSRTCLVECHCEAAVFFNEICAKHKLPMTRATRGTNFTTGMSIAYIKMYSGGSGRDVEAKGRLLNYMVAVGLCAALNTGVFLALLALGAGSYWMFYGRYRLLWRKWALAFQEEIAPRSFSFEEIVKATNSFLFVLGAGCHGTVYKGFIKMYGRPNLVPVAVKRLTNEEREGENDFHAEIRIIGRAHHVNLIRLLGFCNEKPHLVLIYEYMSRGSLANLICGQSDTPGWKLRLDILLGVARGIHYLHRECETKIIHRDIKPENILIAGNWKAKISDFGISKFSMGALHETSTKRTSAPGTTGYVAPECVQSKGKNVTEKADVYSFGIVVLETVFLQRNAVDNNLLDLAMKFCDEIEKERRKEVKLDEAELEKERMVKLAMLCVEENPEARPDMEEVILSIREGLLSVPRVAAVLPSQTIASDKNVSWAPSVK